MAAGVERDLSAKGGSFLIVWGAPVFAALAVSVFSGSALSGAA
ncbi:MAG: hypothetical protein ACT4OF_15225 [Caulobacteraceae bacterium]